MSLVTFIMISSGQAAGLLLELLALLILIRAICSWRPVPLLAEFNAAGRPLVDRTLRGVTRLWGRLIPNRPLSPNRLLFVAWLAVAVLRWCTAIFVRAVAYVT